jgi:hypothetical protein
MKVDAAPPETPGMWTLAYGHDRDRSPTHGYEPTREAAVAAFTRSWELGGGITLFELRSQSTVAVDPSGIKSVPPFPQPLDHLLSCYDCDPARPFNRSLFWLG